MFALQPELKVFSGSANRDLAQRICNFIGAPLGQATISSFPDGETAGETSDKYVRVTVYLATVLFLIGISGHFPVLGTRYGLVSLGALLVIFSVIQLTQLPRPP